MFCLVRADVFVCRDGRHRWQCDATHFGVKLFNVSVRISEEVDCVRNRNPDRLETLRTALSAARQVYNQRPAPDARCRPVKYPFYKDFHTSDIITQR